MSERFKKLYNLSPNLYSEASPVIVSAGALLKDTETGKVIVQLKYQNVSQQPIKALQVGITAYDVTGKEIEGIQEYQYLDLDIKNGHEFGSNKAIILPDAVTRSFSISHITAVLSSGMVSHAEMPLTPLPDGTPIRTVLTDSELIIQYQIDTGKAPTYAPKEYASLWHCTCGNWNSGSICTSCRTSYEKIFYSFNIPALIERATERLASKKAEDTHLHKSFKSGNQETTKTPTATRSKTPKKTLIALIALLVALTVFLLLSISDNETAHFDVNGLKCYLPDESWKICANNETTGRAERHDGDCFVEWLVLYKGEYSSLDGYQNLKNFKTTYISGCDKAYYLIESNEDGPYPSKSIEYYVLCKDSVFYLSYYGSIDLYNNTELASLLKLARFEEYSGNDRK